MCEQIFVSLWIKEQVEWAVRGGADFIVGETYFEFGEAMLALQCIKEYGNGNNSFILCSI